MVVRIDEVAEVERWHDIPFRFLMVPCFCYVIPCDTVSNITTITDNCGKTPAPAKNPMNARSDAIALSQTHGLCGGGGVHFHTVFKIHFVHVNDPKLPSI